MHVHIKRAYKIGLIVLVVMFVGLSILLLNRSTRASVADKKKANIETSTLSNNLISAIPNITAATDSELTNTENVYFAVNQANENIRSTQLLNPSTLEWVFSFFSARNLNNAAEVNSTTTKLLSQQTYDTQTIAKFLIYAPSEDFALLGLDKSQDDERIQRTKTAFQLLIDDDKLSKNIKDSMSSALSALVVFEKDNNLRTYINSIDKSQSEITRNLNNNLDIIKTNYSDYYNSAIYQ